MKSYKITSAVVACMIGIAVQQASANTIGTVNLGTIDINGYTGPYATAKVELTGTTTANFTFTGLTSPVGGYKFGLGDPGINVKPAGVGTPALSNVKVDGSTIPTSLYSGNEDGFGNFNFIANTANGSSTYRHEITFTLTLSTAHWTDVTDIFQLNDPQHNFVAAHVYVFNSDGSPAGATGYITQSSGLQVVTFNVDSVPDGGSTVLLLGAALSGLGMLARRVKK